MIRPKNKTGDFLLSITKNCQTLIGQTHKNTPGFKMTKPTKTFLFNPPIQAVEDWMIGLTEIKVYNSFFNIAEEINKFEFYKFPDEKSSGVSYGKVRYEIERDLDISDITATDLEDNIIVPIIIRVF